MTLSATEYLEKNRLASPNIWMVLLKITMPDGTLFRVAQNKEFVIWPVTNGDTYTAFPFDLGETSESSKGEIPSVSLRMSNISRILIPYLEDQNGLVDSDVNIYVVNSANVYTPSKGWGTNKDTAAVELDFKIIATSLDRSWVTFTLGSSNPYNKRFPRNKVYKNICRYKNFKGSRCQYTGSKTTCNRSLAQCREYGNSINFGGFPGVGTKGTFV